MKKLLIIALLIISNLLVNAQVQSGTYNSLQLCLQPQDLGLGLRYDRYVTNSIGGYFSLTYGNYWLQQGGYIKNHIKASLGISIKAENATYFSLGMTVHEYGEEYIIIPINPNVRDPIGFELGTNGHIGKFIAGFRMDIVKWEGVIDIGIKF